MARIQATSVEMLSFTFISMFNRTLQHTGKDALTWKHYREFMAFLSQTQKCWKSGSGFKRKLRIEIIAKLAKYVNVGTYVHGDAMWNLSTIYAQQQHTCIMLLGAKTAPFA